MTTVWLSEPRSHGRMRKEATRARNGAPLPGRMPSAHVPHQSASPAYGNGAKKRRGSGALWVQGSTLHLVIPAGLPSKTRAVHPDRLLRLRLKRESPRRPLLLPVCPFVRILLVYHAGAGALRDPPLVDWLKFPGIKLNLFSWILR